MTLKIPSNLKRRGEIYDLLCSFDPRLTRHALERIWQRLCRERWLPITLDIKGQKVRWMKVWHWIEPKRIKLILDDIKQSIFSTTYYEEGRWLITEGDYGFYVIGVHQEVITAYPAMRIDQLKTCKNVDFRFRAEWLRQSPYLNKEDLIYDKENTNQFY